jgi:hypothetical protein
MLLHDPPLVILALHGTPSVPRHERISRFMKAHQRMIKGLPTRGYDRLVQLIIQCTPNLSTREPK